MNGDPTPPPPPSPPETPRRPRFLESRGFSQALFMVELAGRLGEWLKDAGGYDIRVPPADGHRVRIVAVGAADKPGLASWLRPRAETIIQRKIERTGIPGFHYRLVSFTAGDDLVLTCDIQFP